MTDFTTSRKCGVTAVSLLALAALGGTASIANAAEETCFSIPAPVISLGFGSRYEADSKTRSDLDDDSDAAVTKALKPIDLFIQNLAKQVTKAGKETDATSRADYQRCVINAVYQWASANYRCLS